MWILLGFTAVIGALILICVLQLRSKYVETQVRYQGKDVKEAHRFDIYTYLLRKGAQALRVFFDETIPPPALPKHLNDHEDTIKRGQHKFDKKQLRVIYPGPDAKPSSAQFDITIMYKLLRNTCASILQEPTSGWGNDPDFDSITKTDDVERIRMHRNTVIHATEISMNQHVFNSKAIDLTQAIIRLSNGSLEKEVIKEVKEEMNIKIEWESSLTICASSKDKKKDEGSQQLLNFFCHTFQEIVKRIPQQKDSDRVCETLNKLEPLVDQLIDSKDFVDIGKLVEGVIDSIEMWSQGNPEDAITVLEHQAKWIINIRRKYDCSVVSKSGSLIMKFTFYLYSGYMKYKADTRDGTLQSEIENFLRHSSYCQMFDLEPEDISFHMEYNQLNVHLYDFGDNGDKEYSLFKAAERGHFKVFKYLVQHGADINLCNAERETPLHIASKNGHSDIVQCLVENLAIINTSDATIPSPLVVASKHGYLDVVACLVQHGADVNLFNADRETPLYIASKNGHANIVQYLVENLAIVNTSDATTPSPLVIASKNGYLHVVRCLVENDADVNLSYQGKSPLYAASESGHDNVVQFLIENGANINMYTGENKTPLFTACVGGHENVVEYLVQHGAGVNLHTNEDKTPLYAASERGHKNIVKYLVEHGANVNFQTCRCYTPLHAASKRGHESVVQYLVKCGAKVNIYSYRQSNLFSAASGEQESVVKFNQYDDFYTSKEGPDAVVKYLAEHTSFLDLYGFGYHSLFAVTEGGYNNIVKYSIKHDVKFNILKRMTPLYIASQAGHEKIVKYLIEHGADVDKSELKCALYGGQYHVERSADIKFYTFGRKTPLYAASEGGHENIVKYLIEKGTDVDFSTHERKSPLHAASEVGHESIVKYLVEKGADVNRDTFEGKTPLHAVCEGGHESVVEYLVEKGADVNRVTFEGKTPLHAACEGGHESIVKYLVEIGADVNRDTFEGKSALHAACEGGHENVVEYLVEKGADVNRVTFEGKAALHAACEGGHESVVEYLVENGADVNRKTYDWIPFRFWYIRHDEFESRIMHNADINSYTFGGRKPLFSACEGGHELIVKHLVEHGAEVNQHHDEDKTPLYAAAEGGHENIVKYLVEHGAEVNQITYENKILLCADSEAEHDHAKIKYLIQDRSSRRW